LANIPFKITHCYQLHGTGIAALLSNTAFMKTGYSVMLLVGALLSMMVACKKSKSDTTPAPPATDTTYFARVKAIMQAKCSSCHNSSGTWAGRPTKFDSDTEIAAQYASIKSAIVDPMTPVNKRMPEGDTLSAGDIDIIVHWYNKGGRITD
jgi:uncharacterized membrane protein